MTTTKRRFNLTDSEALAAINALTWDGQSIAKQLEEIAEWNRKAAAMNWKTPKHFWKMQRGQQFGRWTYDRNEEEEALLETKL